MNKLMSFLNKILESLRVIFRRADHFINSFLKPIIIICVIIYLIIFYQSTLNQRYQYYETVDHGERNIVIFDTKKGEMYNTIYDDFSDHAVWYRISPFSKWHYIRSPR
jgi:nitrate reductase gamma subunit